jgi:hypothetical protein
MSQLTLEQQLLAVDQFISSNPFQFQAKQSLRATLQGLINLRKAAESQNLNEEHFSRDLVAILGGAEHGS